MERHPADPRNNPNHRERGPKSWPHTSDDLCKLFGVCKGTLRRWVREERLDPTDLESIVEMAVKRRVKR